MNNGRLWRPEDPGLFGMIKRVEGERERERVP